MSKLYYSVRKSNQDPKKFKVVLAGGFWGYEDIHLSLFSTIKEALEVAERLQKLKGQN